MKVSCSKNKDHKRFGASAHIVQDWEIDSKGDFVKVVNDCSEVTHRPDSGDVITCLTCGATAIVTKETA